MRILVAEDDKTSRLIIEAAVTSLGHECIVATSGEEAWRLFETVDVEVIISDRMMPGMDGLELCRRIRASNKDTYTYFIFLTILDERPDVVSGMEAGADDYLVKPLDAVELKLRMLVASRVTALHRRLFRQSEELAQLNRQLFDQSRTDSLTRLGNRLKLSEDLDTIGAQSDRYDRSYCAIMCDVDYFKAYNDDEGHPAGDKVLQLVARALMSASRVGDQIYRYGGEDSRFCCQNRISPRSCRSQPLSSGGRRNGDPARWKSQKRGRDHQRRRGAFPGGGAEVDPGLAKRGRCRALSC